VGSLGGGVRRHRRDKKQFWGWGRLGALMIPHGGVGAGPVGHKKEDLVTWSKRGGGGRRLRFGRGVKPLGGRGGREIARGGGGGAVDGGADTGGGRRWDTAKNRIATESAKRGGGEGGGSARREGGGESNGERGEGKLGKENRGTIKRVE